MENDLEFDLSAPQEKKKQVHIRRIVRKIVQFLSDNRGLIPFKDVADALGAKEVYDPELIKQLAGNPKVVVEDGFMRYKPTHDSIRTKEDLKKFLTERPRGSNYEDLKDAYINIDSDLKEMLNRKDIIEVVNTEKKPPQTIIYPRQREHEMHVDDDIKSMWRDIKIPTTDTELDKKLEELGYTDVAALGRRKTKRKLATKKTKVKKKRKQRLLTKITNVHLAKTHANILNELTKPS